MSQVFEPWIVESGVVTCQAKSHLSEDGISGGGRPDRPYAGSPTTGTEARGPRSWDVDRP